MKNKLGKVSVRDGRKNKEMRKERKWARCEFGLFIDNTLLLERQRYDDQFLRPCCIYITIWNAQHDLIQSLAYPVGCRPDADEFG